MHTPRPSYSISALLLEPDPTLALKLQELLTTECRPALDLRIAASFQEGLSYLRTHPVALVLVNLVLPDCPGREAVGLLRQAASSSAVIGFSRPTDTDALLDAIRAGAHEVLFAIPPSAEALNLSIQCALVRAAQSLPRPSHASGLTSSMPLLKAVHDLNNSLTSIKGFADILHARLSAEEPSHHCAEQIQHACAKAEVLIKHLSDASVLSPSLRPSDSADTSTVT